jgi:hypothetical protein
VIAVEASAASAAAGILTAAARAEAGKECAGDESALESFNLTPDCASKVKDALSGLEQS